MEKGKERHMFPGNNTSAGFYSYYQYVLPQKEANHIFCLKGGPGVGKSTFMTRIGKRMQDMGFMAEYLHCSSDPESLDGVLFPQLRVALLDGTAPHVIDPVNPGAVDEIINLGEYWDIDGIKQHKEDIIRVNTEVGKLFKRAYRYAAAAKHMLDDMMEMVRAATNMAGIYKEAELIICKEFPKDCSYKAMGKARKQFASAITPLGIFHFTDTLYDETYKVYIVKNHWGTGVNELLDRISKEAVIRGLDTENYYCPMNPETKIEHVIIPELKVAFLSENKYFKIGETNAEEIDIARYTDPVCFETNEDLMDFSIFCFDMLLNETIETLHNAKTAHDEMEKYYIPHMDFEKENEKLEDTFKRILAFAEQPDASAEYAG